MTHPLHPKNRLKTHHKTHPEITHACRYCRVHFTPKSRRDFFCCVAHKEAFFKQLPKAQNITIRRIKKQPENESQTS